VYLTTAREHPPAVVQRQQQRDMAVLLPTLGGLSEPQTGLFFLAASVITHMERDGLQRLVDADIAEGAAALAATHETAQRGLIYEHRPASPMALRLVSELSAVLAKVGRSGGSRFERDAAAAMRALEKGAREAGGPDPAGTVFLDLITRMVGQSALEALENEESAPRRTSSLIIPGSA
jgi:hypothetical protein